MISRATIFVMSSAAFCLLLVGASSAEITVQMANRRSKFERRSKALIAIAAALATVVAAGGAVAVYKRCGKVRLVNPPVHHSLEAAVGSGNVMNISAHSTPVVQFEDVIAPKELVRDPGQEQCPICFGHSDEKDFIFSCRHWMHSDCRDGQLASSPTQNCPLCRRDERVGVSCGETHKRLNASMEGDFLNAAIKASIKEHQDNGQELSNITINLTQNRPEVVASVETFLRQNFPGVVIVK